MPVRSDDLYLGFGGASHWEDACFSKINCALQVGRENEGRGGGGEAGTTKGGGGKGRVGRHRLGCPRSCECIEPSAGLQKPRVSGHWQ
jgi:hypothetical protein